MATQAEETLHRCLEIILIGPVCTGKSTLAPLLADRLEVPQVSLDQISLTYLEELGDAEATFGTMQQELNHGEATLRNVQQGFLASYRQWEPFFVSAIERLLSKHFDRIIDLGAGHSHYHDPALFERARQPWLSTTFIEHWVKDRCNHELATQAVYTQDKTPQQTSDEILQGVTK